ncbi:MAG TPA: hypothetical protein VGI43_12150 [Mucilaginibacter sp.]
MFQKYYAFYLKCIFLQSPVKVDTFARAIKTQKSMAVLAIDELRNNRYIIVEDDLIKLTSKGLAYLVSNNLISAADQERAAGFEKAIVTAEHRTPAFKITIPAAKLKLSAIKPKVPAVKLPAIKLRIPTIRINTPALKMENPAFGIIKNKRLEILALVVGIISIAVVIGLILAG